MGSTLQNLEKAQGEISKEQGRMEIHLDKAYLMGGGKLTGTLTIQIYTNLQAKDISLTFKGKEKANFYVQNGGRSKSYTLNKTFVERKLTISDELGCMEKGEYNIRFNMETGEELPGTLYFKESRTKASIQYQLIAKIHNSEETLEYIPGLIAKKTIIIQPIIKDYILLEPRFQCIGLVDELICFHRGTTKAQLILNQAAITELNDMNVKVLVENNKCRFQIGSVGISFRQKRSMMGYSFMGRKQVKGYVVDIFNRNIQINHNTEYLEFNCGFGFREAQEGYENSQVDIYKELSKELPSTMNSEHMKIQYFLGIKFNYQRKLQYCSNNGPIFNVPIILSSPILGEFTENKSNISDS